jgi:hypothetical protein
MKLILSDQSKQEIHDHIAGILLDRGESFLNDDGVDEKVCGDIATEITGYIDQVFANLETK